MFKLYNGCPNDELQAHWDACDAATKFIKDNGHLVTWFPMEGCFFMCEAGTYNQVGDAFPTQMAAATYLKRILDK